MRIARLGTDLNNWQTGEWVNSASLYKLEVNDMLEAVCEVEDASENPQTLSKGVRCRFRGWDSHGDALLKCGSKVIAIFLKDLDCFTLV